MKFYFVIAKKNNFFSSMYLDKSSLTKSFLSKTCYTSSALLRKFGSTLYCLGQDEIIVHCLLFRLLCFVSLWMHQPCSEGRNICVTVVTVNFTRTLATSTAVVKYPLHYKNIHDFMKLQSS